VWLGDVNRGSGQTWKSASTSEYGSGLATVSRPGAGFYASQPALTIHRPYTQLIGYEHSNCLVSIHYIRGINCGAYTEREQQGITKSNNKDKQQDRLFNQRLITWLIYWQNCTRRHAAFASVTLTLTRWPWYVNSTCTLGRCIIMPEMNFLGEWFRNILLHTCLLTMPLHAICNWRKTQKNRLK